MILIGFLTTLFVYIGDGPLWMFIDISPEFYNACKDNWWTNLLYVNNLVHPDRQVHYIFTANIYMYTVSHKKVPFLFYFCKVVQLQN